MKYIRQDLSSWIFRLLVAIGCGLMIASFAMPWWIASRMDIMSLNGSSSIPNAISIYGFGLQHKLVQLASFLTGDETPLYQTVLAWVYVAVSICLAMIGTYLKGLKGTFLLGLAGLGYIAYAAASMFMVVSNRLTIYGFALQGESTAFVSGTMITMHAGFAPGYYLAFAAGGWFILLALVRNILKKYKRNN
jgi:hypothetical protein